MAEVVSVREGVSATKLSGLRRSEDCDPNGGGFVGKLIEKFSGAADVGWQRCTVTAVAGHC